MVIVAVRTATAPRARVRTGSELPHGGGGLGAGLVYGRERAGRVTLTTGKDGTAKAQLTVTARSGTAYTATE
ncbi:hypothetical protein AB0D15_38625, partial [Streptomyces sp. NPDC048551]